MLKMSTTSAEPFTTGQIMTREEFLCRWEQVPDLRHAELIEGYVYVPSPLGVYHAEFDGQMSGLLSRYAGATPGCREGTNATWLMLSSAPQPDAYLRILPEFGGQSSIEGKLITGAPELVVELSLTSTDIDFGPKLRLYERAQVREYITIEILARGIAWRVHEKGRYREIEPGDDGVLRCMTFPGLWLNVQAYWERDDEQLAATLEAGLATPEHAAFVQHLKEPARK